MGARAITGRCRLPRGVLSRLSRYRPRQTHRYLGDGAPLDLLKTIKIAGNLLLGERGWPP
jgi:hypothetical protein